MVRLLFISTVVFLLLGCTNRYKVLEPIDPAGNNYKLYILPINNITVDSTESEGQVIIDRPILIDDQDAIKLMRKEWVLPPSEVPKEKNVRYKLVIYDGDEAAITAWIDETFKILIWEDELLSFHDSLLFNYKDEFKYLPEFVIGVVDVEDARIFKSLVLSAGGLIIDKTNIQNHWQNFDGMIELRRPRGDLRPGRKVGKLREKIKDDFPNKDFFLLSYEFDPDSVSMCVSIAADSVFIDFIPEFYTVEREFVKYDSIKFSCIGLEEDELISIAEDNDLNLFQ